jgi:negative regulator of sigma E activity
MKKWFLSSRQQEVPQINNDTGNLIDDFRRFYTENAAISHLMPQLLKGF